jgi:tetratricopeptide (TPR) repeat protein
MMNTTAPVQHQKAETLYQEAMAAYERWDVDEAIERLQETLELVPDNADYHMGMARTLARAGDFDRALRELADFLRLAPRSPATERIEQLFASGMDPVEEVLTTRMKEAGLPLEMIGAAIHMWVEFRIALGGELLSIPKPETWAAALDYTVRKVNLRDVPLSHIADYYEVSETSIRRHKATLVKLLDIMPCDYRYFTEEENPLDKLVEAAELLARLEGRFRSTD